MKSESMEKKRASNIIWNASADYSFEPEIRAYDESGEADLYLNYIIGAVHKYYDYSLLQNFFDYIEKDSSHEFIEDLMWVGLENCAYEKVKDERPVLKGLRQSFAKGILSRCNAASGNYFLDEIRIAHYQRVLGENPKMTGRAFNILKDLEFDGSLNTEDIINRMNKIIKAYFGLGIIPARYGKKRKTRHHKLPSLRLFNISSGRFSGEIEPGKKKKKLSRLACRLHKFIELKEKYERNYIQSCFGASILPETQAKAFERTLCFGNHKNCHLHLTRGEYDADMGTDKNAVNHKQAVLKQRDKNKKHYKDNFAKYSNDISRLTNKIRSTLLNNMESFSETSEAGKLVSGRIWRNVYLYDSRIFIKKLKDDMGNLSVDILLDASSSQSSRREIIAAQAYVLTESLTRCQIPVKVYSFCSERNFTVINLFRDYNEDSKNDRIFDYHSEGCNRDGLAIRTALFMMGASTCENKILIVLSDGAPHDTLGISAGRFNHIRYDYIGDASVNDTALEVRKGLRDGISILCVFTGADEDISDAKKIYGHNLVFGATQVTFHI